MYDAAFERGTFVAVTKETNCWLPLVGAKVLCSLSEPGIVNYIKHN